MFAAVFAATLFMLSAATGGSAADSCTTFLPPLVRGGGECSAPGGGDLVNEINQNISTLLPGVVHYMLQQSESQTSPQETTGSSTPHSHQSKCSVKWVKCFHLVSMSLEAR